MRECDPKNLDKICKQVYDICVEKWGKEDCDKKAEEGTELRQ